MKTTSNLPTLMLKAFNSTKLMPFRVMLILLALGMPIITQSSLAKTVKPTQIVTKNQKILNQLVGKWQGKDPSSGIVVTMIFTPKNQLFVVVPFTIYGANNEVVQTSKVNYKIGYKINANTKPMQIDVGVDDQQKLTTIFEITKGKLHIGENTPGKTRPRTFNSKSIFLRKISNLTTLPKNAQIIDLNTQANKPRPSIAEQYLDILNKAQQAYYIKTGKFAANLEELNIVTNSETEFYRYQIISDGDLNQRVSITAQAKTAEFPSYTSIVFAKKINDQAGTGVGICVTNKPSKLPPKNIKISNSNLSKIECPVGSHLVP